MTAEQTSSEGGEGLTESEVNAVTQDDMQFWLGNKFMDADMLVGKVCFWIDAILTDRLAAVEAERDEAHEKGYWVGYSEGKDEAETRDLDYDALAAERDDLRARLAAVEALSATWERDDEDSLNRFGQHLMGGSVLTCAEHLRAALANPSADQSEA